MYIYKLLSCLFKNMYQYIVNTSQPLCLYILFKKGQKNQTDCDYFSIALSE